MKKRVFYFVFTSILIFTFLCSQLFNIVLHPQTASTYSGTRVKEISAVRGMIYDRNLIPLVNNKYTYTTCVKPTLKATELLKSNNSDKAILEKLKSGNFLILTPTESQIFQNSEDIKNITTYERYGDNTALHIIGYTDSQNNGISGLEMYYDEFLKETGGNIKVAYSADAKGRILLGEDIEIRNNSYYDKDGLVLTIDKKIQEITETALKNGKIDKGAAVVLDVKSSAIIACASTPLYDRKNLAEYINNPNSPFLNRALCAYPVGSVFKAVTASAALENNIELKNFYCNGKITKSLNTFNCINEDGHGYVNLNKAMSVSCNPYFIELGVKTGARSLLTFAENAGFGKSTDLGNGFFTASGTLPSKEELNSEAAVGNLAFGQGKLTATPLQIAAFFATLGNNGVYNEPYLIKGVSDKNGALSPEIKTDGIKLMSESTCNHLKTALLKTTTEGTGKTAFSSLFKACTKTATAQSGQYDENGKEILYCWFAGFFPFDNPKYVICILKENGSSGGADGGPVFKEISENIYISEIKR